MPVLPCGLYEGLACLDVPYDALAPTNVDALSTVVKKSLQHGQSFVRLTGKVGWGTTELDKAIVRFQSDESLQNHDIWVERDCMEDAWTTPRIWTVLDISSLLDSSSAKELRRRLDSLPLMPRPAELVAREPAGSSLTPGYLDEICSRLDPDSAWIYTLDPNVHDKACAVVQRTYSTWGVRYGEAKEA